ncbi:polyadenylate-binding protein RBP47B'-like isoform X2 [Prunus avium]|uniref:Polyadenylate-binding protein RBP47B'-like isoform X2 n=1 Tax=Prunus avium TaxID=42229 RepID=A0A6P5SWR0_PRUAV|nr:polyadenylate-binding protein RBP47B'-like isoform X2 [Prunus avium]
MEINKGEQSKEVSRVSKTEKMMSAQPQPPSSMMAASTTSSQGYQPHHQQTSVEEVRTLWIGDLQYWVDENYLNSCFAHTGEVISIKIIRNKITGQLEGYGFVEFVSHAAAEKNLHSYNGMPMPGTEQPYRLNWASFGIGERRPDAGPEHSIFVGDLAPDVTDYMLQETFRAQYSSVRGAKVVTDPNTGRSKGYGFVKFADEAERNRAMSEMNGVYCSTRQMRISAATPKKTTGFQQQYAAAKVYPVPAYTTPAVPVLPADYDVNNTTIFVGNLDPNVTEEELKQTFMQFGEILYVKIPVDKGCGFVQFGTRASAEDAIQRMQGKMIGQQVVRISWGRSPTAKQDVAGSWSQQVDPSQWVAYYGYGQGYDANAYGATHDPSLYAYGAYAGYGQYPQQVEGVQDIAGMGGAAPSIEQRDESDDPLATPDVDKLNAAYLSVHGRAILGSLMWLRMSSFMQQA